MNRRIKGAFKEVTGIAGVMGIRVSDFRSSNTRFDDIQAMEDRHVCLSLLEAGRANITLANWAYQRLPSRSRKRREELCILEDEIERAGRLLELHPDFVRIWVDGPRLASSAMADAPKTF